jgi:hypothetical protein
MVKLEKENFFIVSYFKKLQKSIFELHYFSRLLFAFLLSVATWKENFILFKVLFFDLLNARKTSFKGKFN